MKHFYSTFILGKVYQKNAGNHNLVHHKCGKLHQIFFYLSYIKHSIRGVQALNNKIKDIYIFFLFYPETVFSFSKLNLYQSLRETITIEKLADFECLKSRKISSLGKKRWVGNGVIKKCSVHK